MFSNLTRTVIIGEKGFPEPIQCLIGLAIHNHGKLATLDQHISVHAIRGGKEALELIF